MRPDPVAARRLDGEGGIELACVDLRPGEDPIGHLATALAAPDVIGATDERAATGRVLIDATLRRGTQRAHRRGAAGQNSTRGQRPRGRRPVRGAVPVRTQPPAVAGPRRGHRVRQAAPRSERPDRCADLRRPDHAIRFHRRLHGVSGSARGVQRESVSRPALDARRAAVGHHGSRRGGGRGDRASARAATPE